MKTLIAIIGYLSIVVAASAQEKSVIVLLHPACKSMANLVTVVDLVKNKPQAEFDRFYEQEFRLKKDCIFLARNQKVTVKAQDKDGHMCVGSTDATECYWTNSEAFEAKQEK